MKKFDIAYFTASCDTVLLNTKFAKSLDLDYPILSDPSKKVAKAFGVVTAKREVPFRWTFYIGLDNKILYIDKEVDAGNHAEAIIKKLTELKVKKK